MPVIYPVYLIMSSFRDVSRGHGLPGEKIRDPANWRRIRRVLMAAASGLAGENRLVLRAWTA
jgi:hypothetical protein